MACRHFAALCALVPGRRSGPALATALVFAAGAAAGAELGRLTLQSGVGEPLRAEIEIRSLAPGEAPTLAARIPPPEVFWRANLEPSAALDRVRVAVERRPGNRHVVALRSSEPFEEPFVQLLVELRSAAGTAVREYPFLLEESRRGARAAAPSLPEVEVSPDRAAREAPPERPARAAASERPGRDAPAREAPAREGPAREGPAREAPARADGYVVRPGDTLATIAQSRRYAGATLDQALVAIFRANEDAFEGGNLDRLRAGAALALPDPDEVRAVDPEEARRFVRDQRRADDAPAAAPPAARAASPAPRSSGRDRDRLSVARAEAAATGAGAAAGAAAREDDLASLQRAFAEAQERIGLLERNLDDVRKLVVMKDQQLARMARSGQVAALGDAAASEAIRPEPEARNPLSRVLDRYGGWLVLGFVLAFTAWVLRPLKTVRLWRKKRRKRMRDLGKHARRVRRAARKAGLLSTSA
jgi:pilus assembly protein FimV